MSYTNPILLDDHDDHHQNNNNGNDQYQQQQAILSIRTPEGAVLFPSFSIGQHVVVQVGAQFLHATVECIEIDKEHENGSDAEINNNNNNNSQEEQQDFSSSSSTNLFFVYFVHFADQDRRMDAWVKADALRISTNVGANMKLASGSGKNNKSKTAATATRTRRQLQQMQQQLSLSSSSMGSTNNNNNFTMTQNSSANSSRGQSISGTPTTINNNNNNQSSSFPSSSSTATTLTKAAGGGISSSQQPQPTTAKHYAAIARQQHSTADSKFFDRPKNVAKFVIGDVEVDSWYYSPYLLAHPKVRKGIEDYNVFKTLPSDYNFSLNNDNNESSPTTSHHQRSSNSNTNNNNNNNTDNSSNRQAPSSLSSRNFVLHLCPYCLEPEFDHQSIVYHLLTCLRRPPGREVYRDPSKKLIVFECDGAIHPHFAKNLALVSKAFLEHKSLDYDMTPFVFYVVCRYDDFGEEEKRKEREKKKRQKKPEEMVMTTRGGRRKKTVVKNEDAADNNNNGNNVQANNNHNDNDNNNNNNLGTSSDEDDDEDPNEIPTDTCSGCRITSYFSREKQNSSNYNLSCILTLPQFQSNGYGRFMIDMSYEMSRREGKVGSPEKPLSDFGERMYRGVWKERILDVLSSWTVMMSCPSIIGLNTNNNNNQNNSNNNNGDKMTMSVQQAFSSSAISPYAPSVNFSRMVSIDSLMQATSMTKQDVTQALQDLKVLDLRAHYYSSSSNANNSSSSNPLQLKLNIDAEVLKNHFKTKIKRQQRGHSIFEPALFHWFPQWYASSKGYAEAMKALNATSSFTGYAARLPTSSEFSAAQQTLQKNGDGNNNNNNNSVDNDDENATVGTMLLASSSSAKKSSSTRKSSSGTTATKKSSAAADKKKSSSTSAKRATSKKTDAASGSTTSKKTRTSSSSSSKSKKKAASPSSSSKPKKSNTSSSSKSSGKRRQRGE